MMFLTIFLLLVSIALSVSLFYSVRRNLEYMEILDAFTDSTEESLQELESYYSKIDKKSKLELFLDEPVTRELMEDIRGTKKAIKKIAEKISVLIEEDSGTEQREKDAQEER